MTRIIGSPKTRTACEKNPVPSRQLRVGMIGMGAIARDHLQRLAINPATQIVGICDISSRMLSSSRERFTTLLEAARDYHDYRELLHAERPDAVIICSPHREHFAQVSDCLRAGVHILVEKPLVNSSSQADEILRLASEAGVTVGIAYQRHTMSHFRYIHEAVRSGAMGEVQSVSAYQQEGWKTVTAGTWRHKPEISGGGYLHDGGSHLVDLVLWSTGLRPVCVSAFQDNLDAPVDVNTSMNIRFNNEALGTLAIMGDTPGWCQRLVIGCERGAIFYGDETGVCIHSATGALVRVPPQDLPRETDVVTNFVSAILHDEPIAAPLECGLAAMQLTEAATESARQGGRPVMLQASDASADVA